MGSDKGLTLSPISHLFLHLLRKSNLSSLTRSAAAPITSPLSAPSSHLLLQRLLLFSLFSALCTIFLRRRYPVARLSKYHERVRILGLRRTYPTNLLAHVHKRFRLHFSPLLSQQQQIYSFPLRS